MRPSRLMWLLCAASLALIVACEPAPAEAEAALAEPVAAEGGDVGLLVLDLAGLGERLAAYGVLPVEATVVLDDAPAGTLTLPEPDGQLDGHVAIPVPADQDVRVSLQARLADGQRWTSVPVVARPEANTVARITFVAGGGEALFAEAPQRLALPEGTQLAIDFRDRLREPVLVERLGGGPAEVIRAVLRDPSVHSVTPFTDAASEADQVGPLMAVPAAAEGAEAPPESTLGFDAPAPEESARAAFLAYYSYCGCGKPAPDRPYTLKTTDGATLAGRTDRFGMIVVPGDLDVAAIDYGAQATLRSRTYEFVKGDADSHSALLAALSSNEPGEMLTALLDLREEPLPEARLALEDFLDHDSLVVWFNAAVTLSFYDDVAPVVAAVTARLEAGQATARDVAILGALRRPAATRQLARALGHEDAEVRATAAWALGFVSAPSAYAPLEAALWDEAPAVRAEALLALGRLGTEGARARVQLERDAADSRGVEAEVRALALATFALGR